MDCVVMPRDLKKLAWICAGLAVVAKAEANGIFRHGRGPQSMALGGAAVGRPEDAISAVLINPAGLSLLGPGQAQIGGLAGIADGEFSNRANDGVSPDGGFGAMPEAAVGGRIGQGPLSLGFGLAPDAAIGAESILEDAPGGLGGATSYGRQAHRSEIFAVRGAVSAALKIGDSLSLGGSVGLVYNRNKLVVPYIFQRTPGLAGAKTLLDLETDGFGFNGMLGMLYEVNDRISLGVTYQTPTKLHSDGDASGNADRQLQNLGAGAAGDFGFDAEVANRFPQILSGGLSWQLHSKVRAIAQVDWFDWSESFDQLDIELRNGSNPNLPGAIDDVVPLGWKDRVVYRAGVEVDLPKDFVGRAGYAYGRSPVPNETLTPMTAAIFEHTLTFGAGWQGQRFGVDLAYQWSLPNSQSVETSALRSGEYSNSRTEVQAHWIGLAASYRF